MQSEAVTTKHFCHRCGNPLPGDPPSTFCPACGVAVGDLTAPAACGYARRMAALIVDWLVLLAAVAPVWLWFSSMDDPTADEAGAYVVMHLLIWGGIAFYWALLPKLWHGRTVGRRLLGIRLVRADYGGPVGYWRAFGRGCLELVLFTLFLIPLAVDLLLPLWGSHRSLSDRGTGTVITRAEPSP